jgi:hypothetical protein
MLSLRQLLSVISVIFAKNDYFSRSIVMCSQGRIQKPICPGAHLRGQKGRVGEGIGGGVPLQ